MYSTPLDARRTASEAVDAVREATDAPLEQCQSALLAVLHILAPHFSDNAAFSEVRNAAINFSVDVDTCFDRRSLGAISNRLYEIFVEKQELSYSSSQDDVELINGLELFADITKKTDPRIPLKVVSANDYDWLTQLIVAVQLDQNTEVRQAALDTLCGLVSACRERVLHFLVESKLSSVLASIVQMPYSIDGDSSPHKRLQSTALRLLATLYTSDVTPPLDHLDYLNRDFFAKLVRSLDYYSGSDVLELFANVVYLLSVSNLGVGVVLGVFQSEPTSCVEFGHVLISELNQKCSPRRLRFLLCLFSLGERHLSQIFYHNDLVALSRILAREMIDRPDKEIREACRDGIKMLVDYGKVDRNDSVINEAFRNCAF